MKLCGRCKEEKEEKDFNKDKYSKTGLRSQCKLCMKKEREKLSDHYKEWRSTPEKLEWYRNYRKGRYQIDKRKVSARNKINWAVSSGKVIRPDYCESCKHHRTTEAHHDDYLKPLNVRWLCSCCHKQWHRDNGEGLNG